MPGDDPERARRLAEALRQNLRRRKAQARGQDASASPLDAAPSADGSTNGDGMADGTIGPPEPQ